MIWIDVYGSLYIPTDNFKNFHPFPPFAGPIDVHFTTNDLGILWAPRGQAFYPPPHGGMIVCDNSWFLALFEPEMNVYRSSEGWKWMEILKIVCKDVRSAITVYRKWLRPRFWAFFGLSSPICRTEIAGSKLLFTAICIY